MGFLEAFDASSRLLERRVKATGPQQRSGALRRLPSVGADPGSKMRAGLMCGKTHSCLGPGSMIDNSPVNFHEKLKRL